MGQESIEQSRWERDKQGFHLIVPFFGFLSEGD